MEEFVKYMSEKMMENDDIRPIIDKVVEDLGITEEEACVLLIYEWTQKTK